MSETIEVMIRAPEELQSVLLTFDGTVVEIFGYGQQQSTRLHARQISDVGISYKDGVLSSPKITFRGRAGHQDFHQLFVSTEEIKPAIEKLAEAVGKAASRYPEASQ